MPVQPPQMTIAGQDLIDSGFTENGQTRFKDTIVDYSKMLFESTIHHADIDKDPNLRREVTHEHVHRAVISISNRFGRRIKARWVLPVHILEYIFMGISGAGASNLNKPIGIAAFTLGLFFVALLVSVRITKGGSE